MSRSRQLMHLYSFRNIPPFTCIFVRAGFSWLGICLQDFLKRSQGNYIGLNDGLMICPPSIQTAFRTSVFLPKYFDKVVNWVCGTIALHGRKRVSMLSVPVNFLFAERPLETWEEVELHRPKATVYRRARMLLAWRVGCDAGANSGRLC